MDPELEKGTLEKGTEKEKGTLLYIDNGKGDIAI
jgi:hypothetical protein